MRNYDAYILALSALMLFVGWFSAYITYRRKLVKLKKQSLIDSQYEQYEEYTRGFDAGWTAAFDYPETVREKCNEYFHTHRP